MIFVDKADHQKPNDVKFEVEEEEDPGRAFHCCVCSLSLCVVTKRGNVIIIFFEIDLIQIFQVSTFHP